MEKKVICNNCEKAYTPSNNIHLRETADGILFRFLSCPNCDAAFLIEARDKAFRKRLDKWEIKERDYPAEQRKQNEKYEARFRELYPIGMEFDDKKEEAQDDESAD